MRIVICNYHSQLGCQVLLCLSEIKDFSLITSVFEKLNLKRAFLTKEKGHGHFFIVWVSIICEKIIMVPRVLIFSYFLISVLTNYIPASLQEIVNEFCISNLFQNIVIFLPLSNTYFLANTLILFRYDLRRWQQYYCGRTNWHNQFFRIS